MCWHTNSGEKLVAILHVHCCTSLNVQGNDNLFLIFQTICNGTKPNGWEDIICNPLVNVVVVQVLFNST
ncbi:Biotin biosynthesis bifunctional protein BioHC [Dirofilaria immitis]